MKRNRNLFEEKIESLKADTFYRQRFDACPHFVAFIGEAHACVTNKSAFPYGQTTAYCRFQDGRADWHPSNAQLEKSAEGIIREIEKDSSFGSRIKAEAAEKANRFYSLCESIVDNELKDLSNDELLRRYDELKSVYLDNLFPSAIVDGFSLATDKLLHQLIFDHLDAIGFSGDKNGIFSSVTAPIFTSFLHEEEIGLLKIAIAGSDKNKLEAHQREFFWLRNNYVRNEILPVSFFIEHIDKIDDDLNKLLEEKRDFPIKNKREKEEIFEKFSFPENIVQLVSFTDVINELQDNRKRSTLWATHYFSLFLQEASRRLNIDLELVKYIVPDEFSLLLGGGLGADELSARKNDCVVLWFEEEFDIILDKEKIEELDGIAKSESEVEVKSGESEIKGLVASSGKTTGRVSIVESSEDIHKVNEGDILVSIMTRPDYISGMKKAVAFVTDEGGITCHAAIIAREMKKPCIIGTKIATQVLHDGDLVEVDADKGVVRIIKKNEV
ncbi:MAG: phosphoenolpyruvate synthase [uncultured bacterium]|nr:MAG: phosphoenolpyruvate synthase [uncultured bacterium]